MRSGTSTFGRTIDKKVRPTEKISRKHKFSVLAAAIAGVLAFRTAQAVDYSWDAAGIAGNPPAGGSGIWNTTALNWTNDAGATYIAWPNLAAPADGAIFGGIGGTINLGAPIIANALVFNSTDYVIDNGGVPAHNLATGTITVTNAADTATISAEITGANSLTKTGAGKLVLSGANTYTGNTTIFDGTIALAPTGNINAAGDISVFFGTFDLGSNAQSANAVVVSSGGSIVGSGTLTAGAYNLDDGIVSANLAGANSTLTKATSGTVTLGGNNTFGGGVSIGGGVLSISSEGNLGDVAGSLPTAPGINIAMNSGTLRSTADLTLSALRSIRVSGGAGGTFDVASGTTTTVNGVISDGGSSTALTKSGTGTLILNGANTYAGTTQVTGGILSLAGGGTLNPTSTLFVLGGTFDVGGTSQTLGPVSLFSGSLAGTGGSITGTSYTVNAGAISAILAGPGGLTKGSPSGTVTLTAANQYSGTTLVNQGTLALGPGGSISSLSNLTVSGGTFALGANSTSANAVTLNSGNITGVGGGVLNGSAYTVSSGTVSAILAGAGANLTKTGTGTVTLSAANTYGGSTNVNAGTLTLGAGGNISGSNALNMGGGTLDIGANNVAIGPVTLSSGNINGSTGTLTAPSYAVQSGAIGAKISGASSGLTKDGTGTVTLRGANSYGGGTIINSGTLASANNTALGGGDITLNGGTLQVGETPGVNGLIGQYYDGAPTNTASVNPDFASLAAFSAKYPGTPNVTANTTTGGVTVFDFSNGGFGNNAPFSSQGDNSADNVAARWTGKINITSAGPTSFFTTSDDASMIYIDGIQVVNNDFYQGATERSGIINLSAGYHDIVIMFAEATGGAGVSASYTPFGGSKQLIPNTVLFNTPAGAASTFGQAYNVNVTNSAAIDLSLSAPASTHNLGTLTRAGSNTLTVGGQGRTLNFANTSISGNPGDNIGFDVAADINPGQISDGASTGLNLIKSGAGALILTNASNDLNGTTIDLKQGALRVQASGAGVDPLGGASVILDGGLLSLSNPAGGTNFNPSLTIADSSTIERAGNTSDTLSTALLIPASKNLTLSVLGGSLSQSTAIAGDGGVIKMGRGTLSYDGAAGNSYGGGTTVNAGVLQLNKPAGVNAVGNLTVNNGRVRWMADEQLPSGASVNLNGGGVLDLNGKTQTIGALNTTGGSISAGTLNVNNITKSGGNTTTINSQVVTSGGNLSVSGGTLRVANNAAGAGANSVTSTAINVTNGGNLRLDLAVGGSNPIGANAINLNNGSLSLAGATSYDQGGLAGQFFKATPFNLNTTNQLAETGSALYSLRGLLAFDSLGGMNSAMEQLMSIPYGAGGLSQNVNFGGNAIGANSYASNLPTAFNAGILNIGTKWTGKINITNAGLTNFFTQSDDGSMIFIDGQQVVYNNFFQGITDRSGSINLSAGLHDITIGFYQGGGGGEVIASYQPAGGARQVIPTGVLFAPNITDTNAINASGNSTINVMDAAQANTGPLTVSGQLNVIGGAVVPSSTTFDGNVTILTTGSGLVTQDVAETNGPVTLTKTGGGALTLNGTSGLTGPINVNMGFLNINGPSNQSATNINALGTVKMTHLSALNPTVGGDVNVNNGGTLDVSVANADLSKVKVGFGGKLSLGAAQSTAAGGVIPSTPIGGTFEIRGFDIGTNYNTVQMAPNSTINMITNGANRIYASQLELSGPGNTFITTSGNVTTFNGGIIGNGGLTLTTNTEVRLEGNGNQLFSGSVIAEIGILKAREAGDLRTISRGITYSGELWADDGGANFSTDRWADDGFIDMHGGALRHFARSNSISSETFGTVNAMGGVTISGQTSDNVANTTGTMIINNLVRPVGGRINFTVVGAGNVMGTGGTGTQFSRFFINNFKNGAGALAPFTQANLNDGIIGGGITVGTDFATYTDAFGVQALTTFRTTADSAGTPWLATENVKRAITAQEALAGSRTVNSLTITNAAAQNLELGTNNLIIDSGGFTQSGGNTLTVNATGGTATTGTITANGGELFALAANTIVFNNAIVNNGATPLAFTIGGGGTIRLANLNNSFTGGINISSSILNTASSTNVGKTIGTNTINFTGPGTLQLKDNSTAVNTTIAYNNNVQNFSNGTIDVNNSSANTGSTFQMGTLLMDTGRTLTITGANTYALSFGATTLNGDATFATNSANLTLGALNDLGSAKTLFKTGGNTLTLSAAATSFTGSAVVNGGLLQVNNATSLGAIPRVTVNNGGIVGFSANNQNLSNVTLNNGAGLRIGGTMDSSATGTMPTSPVTILEINNANIGANWDNVPLNPAGATIRQVVGAAATYASDLNLPGPVVFDIPSQTTTFTGALTGVGSVIKGGGNTMQLATANTYTGGTFVMGGTLNANVANSLGSGPVSVIAGQLGYNAPNAAGGAVISANGAELQALNGQIALGAISSIGNDRFDVATGNIISGDTTRLGLLSRYGNSTTPSNVNLAPGAIVGHAVSGGGTISDLGTASDLFYGLALNSAGSNINVGANTPWMGISNDRAGRQLASGDIIVDDGTTSGGRSFTSMTIQAINGQTFTLGNGSTTNPPPTIQVGIKKSNPANGTVDVHLVGRIAMNSSNANFEAVNKFVGDYGSFVMLNAWNTLGSQAVPLEMLNGSVVDIGGGATPTPGALNGNLTMRAGSVFRLDDASQLQGSGQIYAKPGSIFMLRGNANILMNNGAAAISAQVTGNGSVDSEGTTAGMTNARGAIFRLEIDNINQLEAGTSDQGIFSIVGGNRTEGVLTINRDNSASYLNGGMTIYDNNSRSYTASAGLNIGAGGAFFSANGNANGLFTLTIATATPINIAAGAALTIGSPKIDFFDKNGHVQFDGPFVGNAVASIEKITSGDLTLNNASTGIVGKLVSGDIIGGGGGGNVKFGNGNSNLSDRLLAGTVANNVLINDLVKSDININGTPFTTTARGLVQQKFTINGNTNVDGRKLFVNRSTGSVLAGIDLGNITLNGGGVLSVDESNTDVRVNLTLAGDGTATQTAATDPFDFLNVASDTAGTRRVLTQGRVADVFGVAAVYGTIGGDVTINQVRGGLRFDPLTGAGQLSSGAIINSLGVEGNGAGSLGSIEVRTGQNGVSPLAGGTINLGGNTPLTVFVDSSAGAPITNNPNIVVNVGANRTGVVASNRNATGANAGTVRINSVNLASGSTLSLHVQNTAKMRIGTVNMSGNASISNVISDTDISVGDVAAGANTATFEGTRNTQVTGNVNAGALAANGYVAFDPGVAGTSNVNVASATVRGAISASSGVTNFGNTVINGATPVAGLLETFQSGTASPFFEGPLPASNIHGVKPTLQLYPRRANQARGNTDANFNAATGWVDNSTYTYTGQILIPDNGTLGDGMGSIAFGASFDDSISLKIDGNQVMRDTTWNNSTSSGQLDLSAGWHDIEFRFGEGGGGIGPDNGVVTGWGPNFPDNSGPAAIGIQLDPSIGFDSPSGFNGASGAFATIGNYTNPIDNGSMNLFRQAASGDVNVGAGAELRAGGLAGLSNANLNGAAGSAALLTLVDTGSPVASSMTNLAASGDSTISATANSPIAAANLNVATGANLTLSGGATLTINTTHTLGDGSNTNVNGSKLVINSAAVAGSGGINVNSNGTLGGHGNILGTVTVNNGGHVAPGNSVGTIAVGGLTLNSGGLLDMEGDISGFDRINVTVDNAFSIAGPTTINLSDLGGVGAGDYVLIDYGTAFTGNFSDLSLSSTTLGIYTASLVNDTGDTSIKLHLGAGGPPQWNVDADGSFGDANNWNPATVPGASDSANFLGKITAPRTVTLDGNRSVLDLNFANANKYTIAQGTSGTLSVGGAISVSAAGGHEISAPVSLAGGNTLNVAGGLTLSGQLSLGGGGTVNKTGIGTLTISGPQSHIAGAALNVKAGIVNLNTNAGTAGSAAGSNLALSVSGDGTGTSRVNVGANQDLAELVVNTSDANSQTLDLASPAGAGQFHSITVYAANLAAAKTSLYNAIVNANAAGAADPFDGIIDSGLHAGSNAIGLALLGDHVSVRATRVGDLNLDGQVTISDFIDLASNFNTIGTATWQEGDLNYDRNVTISDFIDLASNFNASYAGGAGVISAEDQATLASFASSIGVDPGVVGSAVPEPGTLSLLAIGAMGLMGRRRRKA